MITIKNISVVNKLPGFITIFNFNQYVPTRWYDNKQELAKLINNECGPVYVSYGTHNLSVYCLVPNYNKLKRIILNHINPGADVPCCFIDL